MLYQIYVITLKELKLLFKDKGALAVLFLLPIIFVTVMTFAGVGNQGVRREKILVINHDTGPVAQRIILRLQENPKLFITEKVNGHALDDIAAEKYLMRRGSGIGLILLFPKNFSEILLSKRLAPTDKTLIKFIADPGTAGENINPLEDLVKIQVQRAASALAGARKYESNLEAIAGQQPKTAQEQIALDINKLRDKVTKMDTIINDRVQFERVAPAGVTNYHTITPESQNVPGYTIFGLFFIVQVIGNTFLREKENGTFDRLLISPISKPILLIGKLLPFYIVNILQVLILFAFGHFVFHIGLGNSFLGLFLVTLATAAVANALGLFIAAISKSAEQMGPLSGLILISMAAVGGIFIPYFEMPHLLQTISFFTPHAWALEGFQDVLVRGYGVLTVLPNVGVLLLFAFLFYLLALLRFRFR